MRKKITLIFFFSSFLFFLIFPLNFFGKINLLSKKISVVEDERREADIAPFTYYPKFIKNLFFRKIGLYSKETIPQYLSDKIILDPQWGIYIVEVCCKFPEEYFVGDIIKVKLDRFIDNSYQETNHWDPFVLNKINKNSFTILFETAYFDEKNKWNVVLNEALITEEGEVLDNKIIYDPHHKISYPITIKDKKNGYIISLEETESRFSISKEKGFPGFYKYSNGFCSKKNCSEKNVFYPIHKALFDTSVIFKDDLYFVLGTDLAGNLRLYYGENLLSNNTFEEHILSPITNNPNRNRNAGRIFYSNGNLYRPSMKNEVDYGEAVNLMRIDKLSKTEYEEIIFKDDFLDQTEFSKFIKDGYYHHLEFLIPQISNPNISLPNGKLKLLLDGAPLSRTTLHGKKIEIKDNDNPMIFN